MVWSDGDGTGSDSLTLDFATIVYRLQLLGFNSVRLPFSFSDLYDKQPASMQRNCAQVISWTCPGANLLISFDAEGVIWPPLVPLTRQLHLQASMLPIPQS